MQNLANAVDTRLIQNDQRNTTQEGVGNVLFAAMRNLATKMEKNYQGNQHINRKVTSVEKQMEGIGNAALEDFNKSINSVAQFFATRLQEKAKDRAIPFQSEVQAELPPCLNSGTDDRNSGAGAQAEQPPVTKAEHTREMNTDSFLTENGKPTQQLQTEQILDQWETNERGRNDWRRSMGFNLPDPSGWGQYRPMLPQKGNYAKGGKPPPMWTNLMGVMEVRPLQISNGL